MLKNRVTVASALIVLCGLLAAPKAARAQEFPGLGVGDLWAANAAFDQQFDQWAYHMSWEVARQIPDDQPLPFNAMTIHDSINASNRAFDRFAMPSSATSSSTSPCQSRMLRATAAGKSREARDRSSPFRPASRSRPAGCACQAASARSAAASSGG